MQRSKLLRRIRILKIVPGFLLIIAIIVASSNLWINKADVKCLLLGGFIVVVSAVVLCLNYFSCLFDSTASLISHLWWGMLYGSFTFGTTYYRDWPYDDRDRLMDMLLMTSTALKCCCDFLDRFCDDVTYRSAFLMQTEVGTLSGFLMAGVAFLSPQSDIDLFLIVIASFFIVINLRMKCNLAFLYLILFVAISGIAVFDNFNQTLNPYALACYYFRLVFPAAADFYFSPLSALERWSWSFEITRCKQFFMFIAFFAFESIFCLLAFYVIALHPEYELVFVIPVVSVSGLLWLCTHCAYLSTEMTLYGKLAECQEFYHKLPTSSGGTSLPHIMSSKGVRLLCLVGQQTIACALLTTLLFGAVSWRRENATYPAILLIIIGLECFSFGRIRELAVKLGGTCAAYALITPTTSANPNSPITLLPADSIQKQNERATSLISAMHRFFALYVIDNLGCDYSTTSLSFNSVEEKIKNLFAKRTKEGSGSGVRYDTYLFYYSGLTAEDGSFIIGDGGSFSPDHVINLWRDSCGDDSNVTPSRLLLILDVAKADPWLQAVKSLRREYVALQTCKPLSFASQKSDVETGQEYSHRPGKFTATWVQWNYDVTNGSRATRSVWLDDEMEESAAKPVYGVSRRWTDFALRVPTSHDGELSNHWKTNYLFICRPCLALSSSCSRRLNLVRLLGAPGRRYRRLKMRWFPPSVLDTGLGFKLINS